MSSQVSTTRRQFLLTILRQNLTPTEVVDWFGCGHANKKKKKLQTSGLLVWKILVGTYKESADLENLCWKYKELAALENPCGNSIRTSIELETLCKID